MLMLFFYALVANALLDLSLRVLWPHPACGPLDVYLYLK
jgi:hypothetical protein